jgi:hypothetical protein
LRNLDAELLLLLLLTQMQMQCWRACCSFFHLASSI